MPDIAFSPGRFAPVVEIVSPDSLDDFYDHSVNCEFTEPTFESLDKPGCLFVSDGHANCFEDATLDSPIPIVTGHQDILFSSGSLISVKGNDVYSCPCIVDACQVLTLPPARKIDEALTRHSCETCLLCTSVRQPWYNFRLWFAPYTVRHCQGHLRLYDRLPPRHPKFPGLRLVAPHFVENPWIDKFAAAASPGQLQFPVLSRDWLNRRRRYIDCPS
jgi:hypothetical protein